MSRTRQNRRERVCHRKLTVIVTMYSDRNTQPLHHFTYYALNVMWKTATVRVAEYDSSGASLRRAEQRLHRVLGIRSIPIKEVLRVINHERHSRRKIAHRVVNNLEILFQTDSQRLANVQ